MSTSAFSSAFKLTKLQTFRIVLDPWYGALKIKVFSSRLPGWRKWVEDQLGELQAEISRKQMKITNQAQAKTKGMRVRKGGRVAAATEETDRLIDEMDLSGLRSEIPIDTLKEGIAAHLFEFVGPSDFPNTPGGRLEFLRQSSTDKNHGSIALVPRDGLHCPSCGHVEPWQKEAWEGCPNCGAAESEPWQFPYGFEPVFDALAMWIRDEAEDIEEFGAPAIEEAAEALGEPQTGSTADGRGSATTSVTRSTPPASSTSAPTSAAETVT